MIYYARGVRRRLTLPMMDLEAHRWFIEGDTFNIDGFTVQEGYITLMDEDGNHYHSSGWHTGNHLALYVDAGSEWIAVWYPFEGLPQSLVDYIVEYL